MNIGYRSTQIIVTCAFLALGSANVTAQKSAGEDVPKDKSSVVASLKEHYDYFMDFRRDSREAQKSEKAVDAERRKLSGPETKTLEIVTKDGPLWAGGTFVRVQEPKPGAKVAAEGEYYSKPFEVGNQIASLPMNQLTTEQKKQMKANAEAMLRQEKHEKLLKETEAAEKRLREVRDAAEKARQELEDKQRAATEARMAAKKAEEQRAAAVQAQAAAAQAQAAAAQAQAKAASERAAADRAEREAIRNGERVQKQISEARERYKREGGPYRMPG